MSALFKRNDKTTIAELEEYYANQNSKGARAWFMALLSLSVTVAVVAALFFGGKWVYNSLVNDSTDGTVTVSETQGENVALPDFDSDTADSSSAPSQGVVTDQAATITRNRDDSTGVSVVVTDSQQTDIPNTGAGNFVWIFIAMSALLGYLISRKKQASRL